MNRQNQNKNQSKASRWTLAKCRSIAKQFESEAIWASCKSSSYKAAVARGFLVECLGAQAQKGGE